MLQQTQQGSPQLPVLRYTDRCMASTFELILVNPSHGAVASAKETAEHLEALWSRFLPTSEVTRFNRGECTASELSPETLLLFKRITAAKAATDGLFDAQVLTDLLRAGYGRSVETNLVAPIVPPGSIDPGGIGKGLAADLIVEKLRSDGCGGVLVNIGGDISVSGTPPSAEGWVVAIEYPEDPERIVTNIVIDEGGLCTSSTRSRRWTRGNEEPHHLIDPRTGEPSRSDVAAATVVAHNACEAEAWAKAALLLGSHEAMKHPILGGSPMILVTNAGEVLSTFDLAPTLDLDLNVEVNV